MKQCKYAGGKKSATFLNNRKKVFQVLWLEPEVRNEVLNKRIA